jgi:hypothetical protein
MIAVESFLARLDAVRQRGAGRWVARCPAHDDRAPSLSVAEAASGTILIKCFAGCASIDVLAAIGLSFRDISPDRPWPKRRRSAGPTPMPVPEEVREDRTGVSLWDNAHPVAAAHREAHDRREAAWRAREAAYGATFDRLMDEYRRASAFWQDSARELPPIEHRARAIAGIASILRVERHARGRAGTRALIRKLLAWEVGELAWANEADSLTLPIAARDRQTLSEARALLADGADEQTEAA